VKDYFETRFRFDPGRAKVWRAIVEDLQERFIPQDRTALDLGCGYGDFINEVRASSKLAVDINGQAAQYLAPEVVFFPADVSRDMSFLADESVDICFASNFLEHFSKEAGARILQEIWRILRPKGLVILLQPNFRYCYRNYFDDYTHETIYTDESLCGLLSAKGFRINHRRPRYLPFSLQSRLPKSYWLTRLYLKLRIPLLAKQMLVVAEKD
jgi:SAM-dependent methyltransferase